ncbi:MAG TPA: STAS domain-containing protein [Gemmataceae bacterium]|jgi:anti-anti-sigma factor|nr:STAS domain-containing protein [Gemmataceae bacterium]
MSAKSLSGPLRVRSTDQVTTVHFTGARVVIDEASAPALFQQLSDLARAVRPGQLVLDFGNVAYLSTVMLATLVRLHKILETAGGRLVLCNLSPDISKVFEVTRLNVLLDIR